MSRKSIENRFSTDIDKYINGIEEEEKIMESEEYYELLELGKSLINKDFSKNSNKKEVFDNTIKNINEYREEVIMKNLRKSKHFIGKVASFALICGLGFSIMQTSFAQEVVGKIVKTISLGHITVYEDEFVEMESYPIPDKLKGKIFDKDGNPLEVFSRDMEKIYTADGIEISHIDGATGEIITVVEEQKKRQEENLIVEDSSKLNDYTCFNVILPTYLPEGYKFDRAEFYKDENGIVENSKYIGLFFTNEETGKYIYMQQRFADEETAYATGGDKIEKIEINGVDAVIYSDRNIDWEMRGIIYALSGRGEVTKDELIKIAESIK